jgi:hypothetical protein
VRRRAVLSPHEDPRARITLCYEQRLLEDASLQGTTKVLFAIGADVHLPAGRRMTPRLVIAQRRRSGRVSMLVESRISTGEPADGWQLHSDTCFIP